MKLTTSKFTRSGSPHRKLYSRLMIPHQDCRPIQKCLLPTPPSTFHLPTIRYPKCNPRQEPHAPLEGPRDSPLTQPSISHRPQRHARENAIQRTHAHDDHAREEESSEAGELRGSTGQDDRDEAQKEDKKRWPGHDVEEPAHGESACACASG